ncbi:MAG: glycosyltransferase [Dehalococcoidia bacterium]|nr:glycosyltransferase [Dehalococcoidia bacterium]
MTSSVGKVVYGGKVLEVQVPPRSLDLLAPFVSKKRRSAIAEAAQTVSQALHGRTVININSTARGGGVAELVQGLCGYAKGAGVDSRWLVIDGDSEFFRITKRIHNNLHREVGDGGPLGKAERAHYEQVLAQNAAAITAQVRTGDIVILHDPQTAGMTEAMLQAGARVIWRSHIGHEHHGELVTGAWEFLRPYVQQADMCIFSLAEYAPAWLDSAAIRIINPSIDPASSKNTDISDTAADILVTVGLLDASTPSTPPRFWRDDGTSGPILHRVGIVTEGVLPRPEDPIVTQVARWDKLKDMAGVMRSFAQMTDAPPNAHLWLVGPAASGVADDPEAHRVFEDCSAEWRTLPEDIRRRVHLVNVPMDDREENAAVINAIQSHATVVVQKSLAEGFGLTVTEAMWKGKPVVASAVGGIRQQIVDGQSGILLPDPSDEAACGQAIRNLLANPAWATELGATARERARELFLPDRHLLQYAELILDTMPEAA